MLTMTHLAIFPLQRKQPPATQWHMTILIIKMFLFHVLCTHVCRHNPHQLAFIYTWCDLYYAFEHGLIPEKV